jgi:hypothetical protein
MDELLEGWTVEHHFFRFTKMGWIENYILAGFLKKHDAWGGG